MSSPMGVCNFYADDVSRVAVKIIVIGYKNCFYDTCLVFWLINKYKVTISFNEVHEYFVLLSLVCNFQDLFWIHFKVKSISKRMFSLFCCALLFSMYVTKYKLCPSSPMLLALLKNAKKYPNPLKLINILLILHQIVYAN